MRVYVTRLSASGVVASDVSRGKVVVQVGALRLTADVAELLILGGSSDRPAPSPKAHRHPPRGHGDIGPDHSAANPGCND